MRVLVTGGAGYVGTMLVPALMRDGHDVVVYDTFWFGDYLPGPGSAHWLVWHDIRGGTIVRCPGDIRDVGTLHRALMGCEAVIHLACLSNDPSSEIDRELTRAINLDAFEPLVEAAYKAGVRRFINCSTSSVYGVSDAPDVREDHPHVPLTLYNTYKSQCEAAFKRWTHGSMDGSGMECVTIRPSTVCGYSPRQRLDLAVNILTNLAVNKGVITVFGGKQMRPNLHIADMVDCYRVLLRAPAELVHGETFNVGAGNVSIEDLALLVREEVWARGGHRAQIETKPIHDARSYQVNSEKIERLLGFRPKRSVREAVADLVGAFGSGLLPDPLTDSRYYNVRRMKEVHAELYKDAPPSEFRPEDGVLSEQDMIRGAQP